MGELQQAGALQGILMKNRAMQQEQEIKGILAQAAQQSGGDPAKMSQTLLQSGNPAAMELGVKLKGLMPKPSEGQFVDTVAADGVTPIRKFVHPNVGDVYPVQQKQDKQGTWGEPYLLNGAMVQKNSLTGEIRTAVTREPQIKVNTGDSTPKAPAGYRFNPDGSLAPIKGGPADPTVRNNRPLTATAQKELIETEEQMQSTQQAMTSLKKALNINNSAMGFFGAGAVATAGSVLPEKIRPNVVDATNELDNLVMSSALPQLKAIFGGQPTEGERKVLLEVAGSSSKNPSVRKGIYERAIEAAERRMKFNADKAKRLRSGTYFNESGAPSEEGWKDI